MTNISHGWDLRGCLLGRWKRETVKYETEILAVSDLNTADHVMKFDVAATDKVSIVHFLFLSR